MTEYIEHEIELPLNTCYDIPEYKLVDYCSVFLAICPETGRWLVLSDPNECKALACLAEHLSIEDSINVCGEESVFSVVTKIESRRFYSTEVRTLENFETMQIYLTNSCNLRCPHCYMNSGSPIHGELTTAEVLSLCSEFKKIGGLYVTLTGGEVTMRKDLKDLLKGIAEVGLRIHILSNGTQWNKDILDLIPNLPIERIQISLDGYDEASNALIRGKGNFQRALRTIDVLVKSGVYTVVVATPWYKELKLHKQDYINFAKSLVSKYADFSNFCFNFSYELLEGRELNGKDVLSNNQDYLRIMRDISEQVYPGSQVSSFAEDHRGGLIFNNCGYGRINVAADGEIFPCSRISDVCSCGNIRNDAFSEIIMRLKNLRKLSQVDNLSPCSACELKYICGGGCRVDHFPGLRSANYCNIPTSSSRACDSKVKSYFYDLMIASQELLNE